MGHPMGLIMRAALLAGRERELGVTKGFQAILCQPPCFVICAEGKQAQTGQVTGPGSHSMSPAQSYTALGAKEPRLSCHQDDALPTLCHQPSP